ncbi:MAG: transcription-repair coupling factor, partial [Pseudomonadota bacterium]
MPDLNRILAAREPLTLSSLPRGSLPLVLADLARAAQGVSGGQRAVFIAPDEAAMRAAAEAARFFAPEVEVIEFPAWDCLPYDRASPALSISAERLAALHRLQRPAQAAQLLVTTINAALQRVLTPFRVRESVREFRVGVQIGHESLAALLTRQGYSRTDTVIDHGEFAVRGSIVDIFPSSLDAGLRLDFFGDELESLRLFDPATQRTVERIDEHLLLPASEALLDEDSIKRFRTRYRELFGANATQDPLYEAVSEGRRLAGMEHWLPLFEERLATLFDHLGKADLVVIDQSALGAAEERLNDIADYHAQRGRIASEKKGSYRPLAADALYLARDEFDAALAKAPAHRATGFASETGAAMVDFGFRSARDFSPERGRGENVYEAAASHLKAVAKSGRKALFAAYSTGSARRIASILEEAGAPTALADSWQHALGLAAKAKAAVVVLPLETGFASDALELLAEQDVLGDRLVRRKKKRKDSDAFLAELQALSRGDLVVHIEHGIGRYLGLEPIPVGKSQHDCVALEYAGGDKLFIPVENIDVLSRYGSSEQAVPLDRLGGEAWQRRRAKLKERITAIAGELMQVAAARALRQATVLASDPASLNQFVDRFPWPETDDQERAIADVLGDLESGRPMDRLVCGDVGFGKTEVALR